MEQRNGKNDVNYIILMKIFAARNDVENKKKVPVSMMKLTV